MSGTGPAELVRQLLRGPDLVAAAVVAQLVWGA